MSLTTDVTKQSNAQLNVIWFSFIAFPVKNNSQLAVSESLSVKDVDNYFKNTVKQSIDDT